MFLLQYPDWTVFAVNDHWTAHVIREVIQREVIHQFHLAQDGTTHYDVLDNISPSTIKGYQKVKIPSVCCGSAAEATDGACDCGKEQNQPGYRANSHL